MSDLCLPPELVLIIARLDYFIWDLIRRTNKEFFRKLRFLRKDHPRYEYYEVVRFIAWVWCGGAADGYRSHWAKLCPALAAEPFSIRQRLIAVHRESDLRKSGQYRHRIFAAQRRKRGRVLGEDSVSWNVSIAFIVKNGIPWIKFQGCYEDMGNGVSDDEDELYRASRHWTVSWSWKPLRKEWLVTRKVHNTDIKLPELQEWYSNIEGLNDHHQTPVYWLFQNLP